jgi:hypothetical protein
VFPSLAFRGRGKSRPADTGANAYFHPNQYFYADKHVDANRNPDEYLDANGDTDAYQHRHSTSYANSNSAPHADSNTCTTYSNPDSANSRFRSLQSAARRSGIDHRKQL